MQKISLKRQASLLVGGVLVVLTLYLSFLANPQLLHITNGDKYGHFLAYFILMIWFGLVYPSFLSHLVSAALLSGMGIGVEFLQDLSATRAFELGDVVASVLGVFAALILLLAGLRKVGLLLRKYSTVF